MQNWQAPYHPYPMKAGLLMGAIFSLGTFSISVPAELFSPTIPQKVLLTFRSLPSPIRYPHITDTTQGKWTYNPPDWWTSGFLPATGYLLNTRRKACNSTAANGLETGDWLALGRSSSSMLLDLGANSGIGHDLGFISFPFVEELAVNPDNKTAIDTINRFANSLAARFNPTIGCTRSWDAPRFSVIIDNMMNLELLFHSANLTGNTTLRQIAISHANTTMRNHIRADGSTWHVVDYNTTTGRVIRKRTAQGYSDNSTWSRGQSWGIYGFANMYRLTRIPAYLETARRLATWFVANLPSDGIVPWDFDAPTPRPADTSAATIAASGLLLLAQLESNDVARDKWIGDALSILTNVAKLAWKPQWQSLLSNGTVNRPANSYSTGIVYGDYYFVKVGNELIDMGLVSCVSSNSVTQVQQQTSTAQHSWVPSRSASWTKPLGYALLCLLGYPWF